MSCKKGGFVTLRHNEVRDIVATLLSDVCKDVKLEPSLLTLNRDKQTMRKTGKTNNELRLDICARSFWARKHSLTLGFLIQTLEFTQNRLWSNVGLERKRKETQPLHQNNGSGWNWWRNRRRRESFFLVTGNITVVEKWNWKIKSDILDTIQRKFCTTQKFVVVFKRLPTSIKNNWWKLLYKQYIWLFLDSGSLSL